MTTWRSSPATMPGLSARWQKLAAPKKASQQVPPITPSGHRIARALRSTPAAESASPEESGPLTIELPIVHWAVFTRFRLEDMLVEAEIIPDIAPHLAHIATFAVHDNPDLIAPQWRISNIESGQCIRAADSYTRSQCIANAKALLKEKTPEEIQALIENAERKYWAETGGA